MRSAVVILMAGVVWAPGAQACSCVGPSPVCSVYFDTPLLFLGHVENVSRAPAIKSATSHIEADQLMVEFTVTKAYRGSPGDLVEIRTSEQGSACGFPFAVGHDYLVFANVGGNGDFVTSHCSRTHEVVDRDGDEDLQWIEGLAKAAPGGSIFGTIQMLTHNSDGAMGREALAGTTVTISGSSAKKATTDADGKFRVDGLPPGAFTVSAAAPPRYAAFGDRKVQVEDRGCAEVDFYTRVDGHISGHVYLADGTPAADVYLTVKMQASDTSAAGRTGFVTTGKDGAFDFGGLAAGSYVLAANMNFSPVTTALHQYYRRVFYPGSATWAGAAILTLDAGQAIGDLRFDLPPDAPPPSAALRVRVLGFDGKPAARAQVLAYDSQWESSVSPSNYTADEHGEAIVMLRPGLHYDIEAVVTSRGGDQSCGGAVGIDAQEKLAPLELMLSHHEGNCLQFKEAPRGDAKQP